MMRGPEKQPLQNEDFENQPLVVTTRHLRVFPQGLKGNGTRFYGILTNDSLLIDSFGSCVLPLTLERLLVEMSASQRKCQKPSLCTVVPLTDRNVSFSRQVTYGWRVNGSLWSQFFLSLVPKCTEVHTVLNAHEPSC